MVYDDIIAIPSFKERFEALRSRGVVGAETFGPYRPLNQRFYLSHEWKLARQEAILRDMACDLAFPGHDIYDRIVVHHIEPLIIEDFEYANEGKLLGLQNLITISFATHNILTYGGNPYFLPERTRGDHCPWILQSS